MSADRPARVSDEQIERAARRYHAYESADPDTFVPWETLGKQTRACLMDIAEDMLTGAEPGGLLLTAAEAAALENAMAVIKARRHANDTSGGVPTHEQHMSRWRALTAADSALTDADIALLDAALARAGGGR